MTSNLTVTRIFLLFPMLANISNGGVGLASGLVPLRTGASKKATMLKVSSLDPAVKTEVWDPATYFTDPENIPPTFSSTSVRGGAENPTMTPALRITSAWAVLGFVSILFKAIKRVAPIAIEPFKGGVPLTKLQTLSYIACLTFFAYAEGYKGFQKKFSPLVVRRAFTLDRPSPFLHRLFAPFYAMALFHATRRRKIVSWSVSVGVSLIVVLVKKLPYPYRNIIDGGVVVGLTWGALSIVLGYMSALITGKLPNVDPHLPVPKED